MPHTFETQGIEIERFYTGVISARNPLAIPIKIFGRRLIELYDAILSGSNAEISVRSTLQRAAGFIQYNTNTVSGVPQKFYSFQPSTQTNTIYPIIDTTTNVFYLSPSSAPTSIVAKTQGQQTSFFGVGPYLYMGNREFQQKWDTGAPQGATKWGIASTAFSASSSAFCGTGADGGANGPRGTVAWTNPANIQGAPDGIYTTSTVSKSAGTYVTADTHLLNATNYGFAIAAGSTITGVQVSVVAHITLNSGTLPGTGPFVACQLLINGTPTGIVKNALLQSSTDITLTFGGAADLWNSTLTTALINGATFGAEFSVYGEQSVNLGDAYNITISLDDAPITIFSSGPPAVVVNAGAGTFSATQGYQYLACYGNSVDSNIANPAPASASTGVFNNKLRVEITVVASTDPQVNQIRVFRTTDTGTGAIFFELPNSPFPNTSTTVFDTAADTALQVSQAVTVGTVAFSAPPAGLVNLEWYAGRLWGSVGSDLYFSAGTDNTPMGNGNSNWPPGNVFHLPTTIVKNVALNGGNGMLSITLDGIHVVQGLTNPGFTVNKFLSDVGARTQNAVDTDGSTVYMFTSDRQFIAISSQGVKELSQPISDQSDSLDPTLAYVAVHRSGSQDSRVFLADGSTGYYPYNLMFGAWEPKRTIAAASACQAIGSIEITPGVYKLLIGATTATQLVLQRDLATFADNGTNYAWNATFGSIPLADPTQLANVESIVLRYRNSGSAPTLGVLPNDTSGAFTTIPSPTFEPPEATAGPTGFTGAKYYLNAGTWTGTAWTQMTHLQLNVAFAAEANQDELLSFGIFPNQSTDQGASALPQVQGR